MRDILAAFILIMLLYILSEGIYACINEQCYHITLSKGVKNNDKN